MMKDCVVEKRKKQPKCEHGEWAMIMMFANVLLAGPLHTASIYHSPLLTILNVLVSSNVN
jgi:hypothetical protein